MSEKKHELYLIAFALVVFAGLILYNAFNTPEMHAVKIDKSAIAAQTADQTDLVDYYLSELAEMEMTDSSVHITGDTVHTITTAVNTAEHANTESAEKTQTDAPSPEGPVNINTATKEQLMTLDGIGEVKAEAILEYRRENGNFRSLDELLEVKGIGEKTLEKIRNSIIV